jgi:hypothetical protein
MLVGQFVEHHDRGLVLQQRRVRRRSSYVIAGMHDECAVLRRCGSRAQIGSEHGGAACRTGTDGIHRQPAMEIVDAEQLHAHHRVARIASITPGHRFGRLFARLRAFETFVLQVGFQGMGLLVSNGIHGQRRRDGRPEHCQPPTDNRLQAHGNSFSYWRGMRTTMPLRLYRIGAAIFQSCNSDEACRRYDE